MRLAATMVIVLVLSGVAHAVSVPTPSATCAAAKLTATGQKAKKLLTCQAKAVKTGAAVDPTCVSQAESTFQTAFSAAENAAVQQGGQCATTGDAATVEGKVATFVTDAVAALHPTATASGCSTAKMKAVGSDVLAVLQAYAADVLAPNNKTLTAALTLAQSQLTQAFADVEALKQGKCLTTGDNLAISKKVHGLVAKVSADVGTFVNLVFRNQTITDLPIPVTLKGTITVSQDGTTSRKVVATYGQGGSTTITMKGSSISLTVGVHTLSLTGALHAVTFDEATTPADQAIEAFTSDIASGQDASQWSPSGQAILALTAITSTPEWFFNAQVARRLDGTAASASIQAAQATAKANSLLSFTRFDWCESLALAVGGAVVGASAAVCAAFVTECVRHPNEVVEIAQGQLPCSAAIDICERLSNGIEGGLFDTMSAVYDSCTAKCGFISCADSNVCNGVEWCDPQSGTCQRGTDLACSPPSGTPPPGSFSCGWCDAAFGCVGTVCNETPPCTGSTFCHPFAGCKTQPPVACEDPTDKCSTAMCTPNGCESTPKTCPKKTSCDPADGVCKGTCPDYCLPYCHPAPAPTFCLVDQCCAENSSGTGESCAAPIPASGVCPPPPESWYGGACWDLIRNGLKPC
jgi:hypothetical protein